MSKTPHFNEPIDDSKPLHGNDRKANINSAPPEVQQKVVDIIIEEGRKHKFNNRDIAYYIAIAKRESSFNPDAASNSTTASGISQVIDDTGKSYGINDTNRFDARANIQAGLDYFSFLRKKIIKDYGTAAGDAEVMIYYAYHYGESSYWYKSEAEKLKPIHKQVRDVLTPLHDLIDTPKYKDSKTVVDEAIRIERLLNDSHGLTIQLIDLLGKDMCGRKVIVISKQVKPVTLAPEKPALTAKSATPALADTTSPNHQADTNNELPEIPPQEEEIIPSLDTLAPDDNSATAQVTNAEPEYVLVAKEYITDGLGRIPEIETNQASPVLILVPRLFHEEYADAITKGLIPDTGNAHHIPVRDAPVFHPPIPTAPPSKAVKIQAKLTPARISAKASMAKPSRGQMLTFDDAVIALKNLGWEHVYSSAFSYIKQVYTKPKLNETPLDTKPVTKGKTFVQSIGSSLKNNELHTNKVKATVTTAKVTAVKVIKFHGDTPWMDIALGEQGVEAIRASFFSDPEWITQNKIHRESQYKIEASEKALRAEHHKPEKNQDAEKIADLKAQIKNATKTKNDAQQAMQQLQDKTNNPRVIEYLHSTDIGDSRSDNTSWCSSFVNWCLLQAGYNGPDQNSARAENWESWGETLSEPRYGAITVVPRPGGKHVGFYVGAKNGRINLLGGNQAAHDGHYGRVTEVSFCKLEDVISYRWPTVGNKIK